jgi:DNA-binding HxlR family transcriptional regulator
MSRAKANSSRKVILNKPCWNPCSIENGLKLVRAKWKGSILWHLRNGPRRFNDLIRQFVGTSKKTIDQQLKELEKDGLIERIIISQKPIAVEYKLTEFGTLALNLLIELRDCLKSSAQHTKNPKV